MKVHVSEHLLPFEFLSEILHKVVDFLPVILYAARPETEGKKDSDTTHHWRERTLAENVPQDAWCHKHA